MTYRERVAIEHPEAVNSDSAGGVWGCPGDYWEGAPNIQSSCDVAHGACTVCWDRQAAPRKVKVRKKK